MRNFIVTASSLLVLASAPSMASAPVDECGVNLSSSIAFFQDAKAKREELVMLAAPIKSAKDLQNYLANLPPNSPLRYFSEAAKSEFLGSLTFGDKGVSGFAYTPIQNELTPTRAYELLSLFGVQRTVSRIGGLRRTSSLDDWVMTNDISLEDHVGYKCQSRGTCEEALTYICTSNC